MALFKPVKKPVIRQAAREGPASSPLRPRYAPMMPPCSAACPIGCDVRGWVSGIGDGESLELAWRRITARNPFPAVTGRLCTHPCENSCYRAAREGAVAVCELERRVGDYGIAQGLKFTRTKELPARIAVLGGGPAGFSAAYHLARRGYRVTVCQPSGAANGALREAGADVVDAEIARIIDLGVKVKSVGAEPGFDATVNTQDLEAADIVSAIARGIAEAETADARLRGVAVQKPTRRSVIARERIKLDWYPAAARLATDDTVAEARRCMACGTCMACGNCWMYCSHSGFEKLPGGKRYRLKLDACNGCKKCADECPSGYIEMV
jgi:Pyruvate/2-oxoacid:ferredoxin oxidoreductase delta subunit